MVHFRVSRTPRLRDSVKLRKLYQRFNAELFQGRLPVVRVGYLAAMKRHVDLRHFNALTIHRQKAVNNRKHWVCFHPRTKQFDETERQNTLIHEMIHVFLVETAQYLGHGKRFQTVFDRLAREGAFTPDYVDDMYHMFRWKKPATVQFTRI